MNEEEAKIWVKNRNNQDWVISRFFNDYPPSKVKEAFFMAGIPGSGKTEFAENTINAIFPKLVPIEHDKLVEYINGYKPEDYYNFRRAGSVLVTRVLEECLSNGYGFIFDGTLSSPRAETNIHKTLDADYHVVVIYIIQDAAKAWDLTQDRELTTKRAIEKDGFIDTCNKINSNLLSIFNRFKSERRFDFWIFSKNGDPAIGQATSVIYSNNQIGSPLEVETILGSSYNLDQLS